MGKTHEQCGVLFRDNPPSFGPEGSERYVDSRIGKTACYNSSLIVSFYKKSERTKDPDIEIPMNRNVCRIQPNNTIEWVVEGKTSAELSEGYYRRLYVLYDERLILDINKNIGSGFVEIEPDTGSIKSDWSQDEFEFSERTASFDNNIIRVENQSGELYFETTSGVYCYDRAGERQWFRPFKHGENDTSLFGTGGWQFGRGYLDIYSETENPGRNPAFRIHLETGELLHGSHMDSDQATKYLDFSTINRHLPVRRGVVTELLDPTGSVVWKNRFDNRVEDVISTGANTAVYTEEKSGGKESYAELERRLFGIDERGNERWSTTVTSNAQFQSAEDGIEIWWQEDNERRGAKIDPRTGAVLVVVEGTEEKIVEFGL